MNQAVTEDTARAEGPASTPPAPADHTRRAARGFVSIAGSKLYFLLAGYAAQMFLPRLLGSPEAFGLFSAALSFLSILNNVLVGATVQVVSKRVSEDRGRAPYALRQALELQLGLGLFLAALLFGCAPLLGERVLLDPLLTPLFRLSGAIVLAYALYTAFIGALNGQQEFRTQARFDMGYTTLRTLGMLGAAALGFGALGAFYGFALAAWLVMLASALVVGLGKRGERAPLSSWVSFMAPLWMYQLCQNLLLQADTTLLKRSVAAVMQAQGSDLAAAAETASRYVGFYRAAQTFAFVPFQLIMSVALVLFPMVSQAVSLGDEAAAARYIRAALRFSLLVLLSVAAPIAGASRGVMQLVYPAAYAEGAGALSVLAIAMVGMGLFVISATIMTGAGKPALAARIAIVAVLIVVLGNLGLVHYVGVGEHTLTAAALGTGAGILVALIALGRAVQLRFGAFIPVASVLRALAAGTVAVVLAQLSSQLVHLPAKLGTLVSLTFGFVGYAATLALLRELGPTDYAAIKRLVRR
ncbi:MAG: oligosaccharide flippase family protein [Polyangiales bacterium]